MIRTSRLLSSLFFLLCVFVAPWWIRASLGNTAAASESAPLQPAFGEPGISPDGSTIAFVSGGDIWTVPSSGGEARLLISHPAMESRPLYSPDGKRLAFVSERTGNGDVYVLEFATGELRRLTYDDSPDRLDGWSRDGRWIYFSAGVNEPGYLNDIYRVRVEGGTPQAVSADFYANQFQAAPSPDGSRIAFAARGIASEQWWRKGHSHLDESEIWLMEDKVPPHYQQLSDSGAKSLWPMWSGDGASVYYVNDRSGAQNIWVQPVGGAAKQVTPFKDGRVLWPSITPDGRTIVFERDFGIWKLDTSSGQASPVSITRVGVPVGPAVTHLTLNNRFQELALSPDGKKVAFVVHGEIFAASAKDGGEAARVTFTPSAAESNVTWSPDSMKLVYVSDRGATNRIFLYDFATNAETPLTSSDRDDAQPRFSPDGKSIAFFRDARQLILLELASKKERVLASGQFDRPPFGTSRAFAWSPDNRWIAFLQLTARGFREVFAVPAAGGASQPVSFLGNVFSGDVSWSPDGTYLLFGTTQRTETTQVARVDLIPHAPMFREDQFRDLFKPESPKPTAPGETSSPAQPAESKPATPAASNSAAKPGATEEKKPAAKPVEITFEGIRRRLSLVPTGVDVNEQIISPDGKLLLLTASVAGQTNLYVYPLDELAKEPPVARQLTSTAPPKSAAQFTPDSKDVFYLEGGTIHSVNVESRQVKPLAVSAEMDVDFAQEKIEIFEQSWRYLRDLFFDPNFNGVDWNAVHSEYAPRIAAAATPEEERRLIRLMLGELNASHLGISAPPGMGESAAGRLGLDFDRREYEDSGRLKISHLVPLGPADLAKTIHTGEYLLAVEEKSTAPPANLDQLLDHTVGKRIVLKISSSPDGKDARNVIVKPVDGGDEKELRYREWVEQRRAYVEKASNGRLGYAHMRDMSQDSLESLFLQLDTENQSRQGVVIDVRNNQGGFVNVYAIDVLARRGYLTMTPRGQGSYPARAELGQRALELPTILVTNQHALSDAEDFTEGYHSLHLGKVVGEPTGGWIIYTGGTRLIDGSILRLPFIKITAADGTPMEMHPRPVDVLVVRPIGESYSGKDSQLDVAVRELLNQIDSNRK